MEGRNGMSELIAKALVLIALTCVPIGITVGFLTDDKYRNPFVFILILFFTYIGGTIWVKSRKEKQK
jgi:ribose/xylose/arabinose/galactoside ABC-type transport system permease subunit